MSNAGRCHCGYETPYVDNENEMWEILTLHQDHCLVFQGVMDSKEVSFYDCGCIDHNDYENIGCESCHYISCLDCHHIDSTPVNVDDWKCKEGYGCKSHYNCTRCGHMGENNLVHEVGMVCDACMTKEDWRVWDLEKRNPDSYLCVKCGKDATEDYLVPKVGMVCDGCMTVADLDAWHAHNKLSNPDSYDNEEASE